MSSPKCLKQCTIGILGGGQLGRMFVLDARRMGHRVKILDPLADGPAGSLADEVVVGSYNDPEAIKRLAVGCDVVTVETEHCNVEGLYAVQRSGVPVHPAPSTIALIQDKFAQKEHLSAQGCRVGPYRSVGSATELRQLAAEWGLPLMLKARRESYDGYGNAVIKTVEDIEPAITKLSKGDLVQRPLYAEKWVPFTKEVAVMVARRPSGEVAAYPVVEIIQYDNVCRAVVAPAQIASETAKLASAAAEKAIGCLEGGGIFGVELFLLEDGSVLLNEIAPRTHNSGHYTMEACVTSQFEQHLRAILGLPLGDCSMRVGAAMMINMLGQGESFEDTTACIGVAHSVPGASTHWYGKSKVVERRKMGHVTIVAPSMNELANRISAFKDVPGLGPIFGNGKCPVKLQPLVGIIMGSDSDLPVMKAAAAELEAFGVPFEVTIVSAHRTPDRMLEYARSAPSRGLRVIIAGAGGAAHLPGMVASLTPLPVIGVPVKGSSTDGVDSLYSIVQMPKGIPCATVAINGAANAGLLAIRILGVENPSLMAKMEQYQRNLKEEVMKKVEVLDEKGWKEYVYVKPAGH